MHADIIQENNLTPAK